MAMKRSGDNTNRLMSRARRTLVAMNLDVTWMAVSSSVRSPVASAPSRSWSCKTCLQSRFVRSFVRSFVCTG